MGNNKEFDNILNECLERMLVNGETVEQCLASYPEQATELEPLLQTALATKKASAIQPRPEFKARARYQFHSALHELEVKRNRPFFSWRQPRWATAIAVILILLVVGGGTVVTAGNSMPDDALYSVKLATEEIRLTLTPSDLDKAKLYASFADKRVPEIAQMAKEGKPELVEQTAHLLNLQLAMVASLVSIEGEGPEMMLAPAPAQAPTPAPAPPVERTPQPAEKAGGEESVPTQQDDERNELKATMEYYAIQHPEILRTALKEAPESAKPALQNAIDISVAGYNNALQALGE